MPAPATPLLVQLLRSTVWLIEYYGEREYPDQPVLHELTATMHRAIAHLSDAPITPSYNPAQGGRNC